jgi:hypothetical protein
MQMPEMAKDVFMPALWGGGAARVKSGAPRGIFVTVPRNMRQTADTRRFYCSVAVRTQCIAEVPGAAVR